MLILKELSYRRKSWMEGYKPGELSKALKSRDCLYGHS